MGVFTSSYWILKQSYSLLGSAYANFRAYFNAKQYLKSEVEGQPNSKYYAVIYGVNNKAARAFAKFLASKGFNLILIERH